MPDSLTAAQIKEMLSNNRNQLDSIEKKQQTLIRKQTCLSQLREFIYNKDWRLRRIEELLEFKNLSVFMEQVDYLVAEIKEIDETINSFVVSHEEEFT